MFSQRVVYSALVLTLFNIIETHTQEQQCNIQAFSTCVGEEFAAQPQFSDFVDAIRKSKVPDVSPSVLTELCKTSSQLKQCVGTALSGCPPKYRMTFDFISSAADFLCTNEAEYLEYRSCITTNDTSLILSSCLDEPTYNVTVLMSNTENFTIDSPEMCKELADAKSCVWNSMEGQCNEAERDFVYSYLDAVTMSHEVFLGCYNVIMPTTPDAPVMVEPTTTVTTPSAPTDITESHPEISTSEPEINVSQDNQTTPEPEAEPEVLAINQTTTEPGAEPEAMPVDQTPEPEVEPEVMPVNQTTPEPEAEPEVLPVNQTTPEPEAEPEVLPVNQTTPEPEAEPEVLPVNQTTPEPEAEPEVVPVNQTTPEPGAEPEVIAVNQTNPEPEVSQMNHSTAEPEREVNLVIQANSTTSIPVVESTYMASEEGSASVSADADGVACGFERLGECKEKTLDKNEYYEHITSLHKLIQVSNITSDDVQIMCRKFKDFKSCVGDFYSNCSKSIGITYQTIMASIDFICGDEFQGYLANTKCLGSFDIKNETVMCVKNIMKDMPKVVLSGDLSEEKMNRGCRQVQATGDCSVNAAYDECGYDAAAAVASAVQAVLAPFRNYLLCDMTPYNGEFKAPANPAIILEPTASEPTTTTSEPMTPEPTTTTSEPMTPEPTTTTSKPMTPEPTTTTSEPMTPEPTTTTSEPTTPEPTTTTSEPTTPEPTTTTSEPMTPEPTATTPDPVTTTQPTTTTTTMPTTTTTEFPEMETDCNKCHYNGPFVPEKMKRRYNYWCHINCPFYCPESHCKCGCAPTKPIRPSCSPARAFRYTPGMTEWCNTNCVKKETCPMNICLCEWPVTSFEEDVPPPPPNSAIDDTDEEEDFDFNNFF